VKGGRRYCIDGGSGCEGRQGCTLSMALSCSMRSEGENSCAEAGRAMLDISPR
jgi:hypothetical protein